VTDTNRIELYSHPIIIAAPNTTFYFSIQIPVFFCTSNHDKMYSAWFGIMLAENPYPALRN